MHLMIGTVNNVIIRILPEEINVIVVNIRKHKIVD